MSTQPTDAELFALIKEHLGLDQRRDDTVINRSTGRFHDAQRYRDFAAAVLAIAKWGQPAQAAEPVARLEIGKTKGGVSLTHIAEPAAFQLQEGMYALYTSPQPPQEPLTDEHIRAMLNKHPPEDVCGWSYRMGIDDAELHHGIKGGPHGDDKP